MFAQSPKTVSFILDAEIVAIDPSDGSLKSFQDLSSRARRDVRIDNIKLAVCVFAFDIMYLDGAVSALNSVDEPSRSDSALDSVTETLP